MTNSITLMPLSIVGAMLLLQPPIQGQNSDPQLPVSLERIRAALDEPPPVLRAAQPSGEMPTFRVEVRQQFWAPQPIDDKAFDPTLGLPSVGELLVGGIGKIRSAAVGYKHRRAKRRARQDVDDALMAFCAVHGCAEPDTRQ